MKIDRQLAKALGEVLQDNTHRINRIRSVGTGLFTAISAAIAFLVEPRQPDNDESWFIIFCGVAIYFVLSLVLMLVTRAHARALGFSSFAIPFLDIPVVIAIQAFTIVHGASQPGHLAVFTVSLLVCFIILSTFTLDFRKLGVTVAVATIGQLYLGHLAGLSLGAQLSSIAVFAVVSWICIFAKQTRVDLVTRVTKANARRARLQRYFSPGVGELIESHDEEHMAQGRQCDLTIVFTDIRGFTRISENLTGPEIIKLLNLYHARMVEAVFKHGGTLDKYLGDGLMIYFNAPVAQSDHAQRAILCALEMQREIVAMNAECSWHGKQQLRIGIGIHSGRAVLGDIGAPHRREFTAIGDAVNVAARLQELTKEFSHDVIVSRATASLVESEFDWTSLGRVPLRGRDQTIEILAPGPVVDVES